MMLQGIRRFESSPLRWLIGIQDVAVCFYRRHRILG
jgi:hypothetical protein